MAEFVTLPDGWTELTYEIGPDMASDPYHERFDAEWIDPTGYISVRASHAVEGHLGRVYPVVVEQVIESGPYWTTVTTHGRFCDDRKEAEESVQTFIDGVENGEHRVVAINHRVWERTVQFYTVTDSELPDGYTGQDLIDALDRAEESGETISFDDETSDVTLDEADSLTVDIYPLPENEVYGWE